MPNLGSVLKAEISRLARKEIKAQVDPLRKANAAHRREIVELKRQVASLQRAARVTSKSPAQAQESPLAHGSTRFFAKGLKSLRARLGLSAADFGKLAGASGQSVYNWESGKTVPARLQQATLASLRGLGKREALARLESQNKAAAARKKKK